MSLKSSSSCPTIPPDKIFYISGEELGAMRGGVYPHRDTYKVYFKGDWFYNDEHGKPLFHERQAYNFLEHLNELWKQKAYDPTLFKKKSPFRFDDAFELYHKVRVNDSEWHKAKRGYFKNYLQPSVFPSFPNFTYQEPSIRWLTVQETDHIFEFILSEDRAVFEFLRYYAVRPSEACGLLKNKVVCETGEIVIDSVFVDGKQKARTKRKKVHKLPITPEMAPYLKGQQDSIYVFSTRGSHYTTKMLEARWDKAVALAHEKYGVRVLSLYKIRHSWATQKRREGRSLDQIRAVLGHSDIRTTEKYTDTGAGELVSILRGRK